MINSALRTWCAISVLCISAFTMVTSEFAPIGLLSQIATDLRQEPATVGLTVTLYAWIGALSGLLSSGLSQRVPRRTLLIGLMLILAASNGLAALSSEFSMLLAARVLGAVAHGVFWAIVAATAAQIAPASRLGLATSIVLGGITVATVMGVPSVNLIGQSQGWRSAFAVLALICVTSAVAIALVIAPLPRAVAASGGSLLAVLRRKDLLITYGITGLTAAAHFAAYTFVEPFIGQIPGITPYLVASLLFAFGAAGFLGSVLSAVLIDRFLKPFILAALIALLAALLALSVFGPSAGIMGVTGFLLIWGVAISCLFTGLQAWVLRLAGADTVPAAALHTAVLNGAIGVGVIVGGASLQAAGLSAAMLVASLVILPAVVLMMVCVRPSVYAQPAERG